MDLTKEQIIKEYKSSIEKWEKLEQDGAVLDHDLMDGVQKYCGCCRVHIKRAEDKWVLRCHECPLNEGDKDEQGACYSYGTFKQISEMLDEDTLDEEEWEEEGYKENCDKLQLLLKEFAVEVKEKLTAAIEELEG